MNISGTINDTLATNARASVIPVERERVITADAAEYGGARTIREAVTNHQVTTRDRLALYRERGWHGLGEVIEDGLNGEEAVKRYLGWQVESHPVFAEIDGGKVELPAKVNVRSDTREVLGMVSKDYRIVQNLDLGKFADALVGADTAIRMETCGSLLAGRKVFFLCRVPQEIRIGKGGEDVTVPYLLLANGHDGTMAMTVRWTMVRVVCNNTYTQALGSVDGDVERGSAFRIRHVGEVASQLDEARRCLGIAAKGITQYEEAAKALAAAKLSGSELYTYFADAYTRMFGAVDEKSTKEQDEAAVIRRNRIVAEWTALMDDENQRFAGIGGSAWAAVNAVTQWWDHERRTNVKGDRFDHLKLLGVGANGKRQAMKAALALV